jgi:hypothetical protein
MLLDTFGSIKRVCFFFPGDTGGVGINGEVRPNGLGFSKDIPREGLTRAFQQQHILAGGKSSSDSLPSTHQIGICESEIGCREYGGQFLNLVDPPPPRQEGDPVWPECLRDPCHSLLQRLFGLQIDRVDEFETAPQDFRVDGCVIESNAQSLRRFPSSHFKGGLTDINSQDFAAGFSAQEQGVVANVAAHIENRTADLQSRNKMQQQGRSIEDKHTFL